MRYNLTKTVSFEWDENKNKLNQKKHNISFVKDFLPKPEDLVFKEDTVKVTLNLSKSSIEFFKEIAKKHGSQYQKVIRNLLDNYTSHYS